MRVVLWQLDWRAKGPGLQALALDRDGPRAQRVAQVVAMLDPDILILLGLDWDLGDVTAQALIRALARSDLTLPHHASARPVTGLPSGVDLNGDGRIAGPGDALGWGLYPGQGGVHVFSRWPLGPVEDHTQLKWADGPSTQSATVGLPPAAIERLPLATSALFSVGIPTDPPLTLWATAASTPVFDGPKDRNGKRNADQLRNLTRLVDQTPTDQHVLVAANLNVDPVDGEGAQEVLTNLLTHPRLSDPAPRRPGPVEQTPGHKGDPGLDTVEWAGPGPLRVSYLLPDARLRVLDSGVYWAADDAAWQGEDAPSRHRPVWLDLDLGFP